MNLSARSRIFVVYCFSHTFPFPIPSIKQGTDQIMAPSPTRTPVTAHPSTPVNSPPPITSQSQPPSAQPTQQQSTTTTWQQLAVSISRITTLSHLTFGAICLLCRHKKNEVKSMNESFCFSLRIA